MIRINFVMFQPRLEIDGQAFDLGWPINDAIALEDRVIVEVSHYNFPKSDPLRSRNVFALDRQGRELWRIAASRATFTDQQGRTYPCPYMNLHWSPDGSRLVIDDQSGTRLDLDPATGALSNVRRFEK